MYTSCTFLVRVLHILSTSEEQVSVVCLEQKKPISITGWYQPISLESDMYRLSDTDGDVLSATFSF